MQQGRGGRRDETRHARHDQQGVEGDDGPVVAVDALHQLGAEPTQGHQLKQAVRGNGDVRNLLGNGSSRVDGNPDIGLGERGGIVDAVSDHDDGVSVFPGLFDEGGLVLRQHAGAVVIDAHRTGHGGGGLLVIARHHHDLGDAELMQRPDGLGHLGAQGIVDADDGCQHARNAQVQMRIFMGQGVEFFLFSRRDDTLLVVKDEMCAADDDLVLLHRTRNAVGHHVFDAGMVFVVTEAAGGGFGHDGIGH